MTAAYSAYKVAAGETPASSAKFDNFVQAVEDALNGIGDQSRMAWASGEIIALDQLERTGAAIGQAVVWDGTKWAPGTVAGGSGSGSVVYQKTALKTVTNTAAKTDLLNGEFIIGAGVMSATGRIWLTAGGDFLNNSGSNTNNVKLELKLGGNVLWDSGSSSGVDNSTVRRAWHFDCVIQAMGTENAQRGSGLFFMSADDAPDVGGGGGLNWGYDLVDSAPFLTAATATNMTIANALTLSATLSAANTNLTIRCYHARAEVT